MIIDRISNIGSYTGVPALKDVADFIRENNLSDLPDGKTVIDEDRFFVMIQHPDLKAKEDALPEAHDRYADVQVVLKGREVMGYAYRPSLGEPVEDHPENDIAFYKGGTFDPLTFEEGTFALFLPQDAHAPCIAPAVDGGPVTKAVFKVRV